MNAQLPVDPEWGPCWHLGVLPLTDGSTAVSLVVSHCLLDGLGVAGAIAKHGVIHERKAVVRPCSAVGRAASQVCACRTYLERHRSVSAFARDTGWGPRIVPHSYPQQRASKPQTIDHSHRGPSSPRAGADIVVVGAPEVAALTSSVIAALRRYGLPDPTVQIRVVDTLQRHQTTAKLKRFIPLR
jgi:hypothetical protein